MPNATPVRLLRRTETYANGATVDVYTDGVFKYWPYRVGWRRGWRWALVHWPDHARGTFHGCAPTLAEARLDAHAYYEGDAGG